ncbi:MAG: hypothetical protein ACYCOU_09585 [Sulfobacillus sp.]
MPIIAAVILVITSAFFWHFQPTHMDGFAVASVALQVINALALLSTLILIVRYRYLGKTINWSVWFMTSIQYACVICGNIAYAIGAQVDVGSANAQMVISLNVIPIIFWGIAGVFMCRRKRTNYESVV